MRSLGRHVLVVALVGALAGCGLFKVQGPIPPAYTEGPAVLSQWIRDHVGGTASMKALVRVSLRAPQGNLSFDGLLFSARPSSLRLQGFSPLGQRMFDLVSQEGQVALRIDSEQRTVEGTIDELGRGLKLPALPQLLELMATMTIVPPDPSHRVIMEMAGEGRRATPVLIFSVGTEEERSVIRRIWLDRSGLPREEAWYDGQQRRTALMHYERYALVDHRWQPRQIAAELSGDVAVTVTIKEWQPVGVWRPEDFTIDRGGDAIARG
ncbi:MAG: hypothetical protein AB1515_07170 [Nitrospirota bacterium]